MATHRKANINQELAIIAKLESIFEGEPPRNTVQPYPSGWTDGRVAREVGEARGETVPLGSVQRMREQVFGWSTKAIRKKQETAELPGDPVELATEALLKIEKLEARVSALAAENVDLQRRVETANRDLQERLLHLEQNTRPLKVVGGSDRLL